MKIDARLSSDVPLSEVAVSEADGDLATQLRALHTQLGATS